LFVNAAKGISSLQLSRDLELHAKTAFVLLHKLRCAFTSSFATTRLSGIVEIDSGWFGGYVRPENHRVARIDRRRRQHQSGNRRCVVVMRQRGRPTVTAVVKHEAEAVPIIRRRVARGSIVHADEAKAWDDLHASFEMKRINHREAYSKGGACTNPAESYISRLRRAEIGQHHHIAGPHLGQYAGEMAWREDMRRAATGTLGPGPSAIACLGGILAAAFPEVDRMASSRPVVLRSCGPLPLTVGVRASCPSARSRAATGSSSLPECPAPWTKTKVAIVLPTTAQPR
jgi:hypothetical protein